MKKAKFRNKREKCCKNGSILCLTFLAICFFCWYFFANFNKKITPRLIEIATTNIEKLTYNIFNDYSLISEMDEDLLSNILILNKNNNGEIINVNYNMKNAYKITNILANRIKNDYQAIESGNKEIDYYDEELTDMQDGLVLSIPIGAASDQIYLNNLGPKIPIRIKFIGTLITNLKTKIKNYGINNVLIELYVDVAITHEVITPVTFKKNELNYEIMIAAQVINGEVPSYYGGLYETKSNILNLPLQ